MKKDRNFLIVTLIAEVFGLIAIIMGIVTLGAICIKVSYDWQLKVAVSSLVIFAIAMIVGGIMIKFDKQESARDD